MKGNCMNLISNHILVNDVFVKQLVVRCTLKIQMPLRRAFVFLFSNNLLT